MNASEMQRDAHNLPPNQTDRNYDEQTFATNNRMHHDGSETDDKGSCNNCASLAKRVARLENQHEISMQLFAKLIEESSQKSDAAIITAANSNGRSSRGEAPPTFDDLQECFDFVKEDQARQNKIIDQVEERVRLFVDPIATLRRDVDSLFAWHQSVVEADDRRAQEDARAKPVKVVRKSYTDRWKVDFRPESAGSEPSAEGT
jgi:hypothetical protein